MRATVVALAALAACKPPPPVFEHSAPPAAGLAIAIYEDGDRMVALVDDRRTVEVHNDEVLLDQLDAGASLASLVVEPVGVAARTFRIGPCRREAATTVRCAAHGTTGAVFVRIFYASNTLAFRSRHVISVAGERATIETTFALELPAWGRRATIALYDGIPGGARPPVQLGAIERVLDGTTAAIEIPAREVKARRIVVFDPLRRVGDEDAARRDDDTLRGLLAWEWLELVGTALPPGDLDVRADIDSDDPVAAEVPTSSTVTVGATLRIPLRADPMVRGRRERHGQIEQQRVQIDQLRFWLTNEDTRAHRVLIEEELRTGTARVLEGSPHRPTIIGDIARLELEVPANGTARAAFTIRYAP